MRGYKGMNKDMTCRGMKFEIGKTYRVDGKLELCRTGLHFCRNMRDVFSYYRKDTSRYFEIEAAEPIISDGDKSVSAEITVIRELSDIEINRCYYGSGDGGGYGYGNGDVYGCGDGDGDGYGCGYGYGCGHGNGCGNGCGYGYGGDNGCDHGYGDGCYYGNGNGNGRACNFAKNIQRILMLQ